MRVKNFPKTGVIISFAPQELEAAALALPKSKRNELIGEVEYALELLSKNSEFGSSFTKDTRRILLRRFPYSMTYIVEQDILIIVAIAHQRKLPGYWQDRL